MKQSMMQQQTAKLMMTNELRQAISLLQYSSLELIHYLQEQATENPLLSIEYFSYEQRQKKKFHTPSSANPFAKMEHQTNTTIHEHLRKQVGLLPIEPNKKQIINYLILSIDPSGYFTGNIDEISQLFSVPTSVIECLLEKIQECEPVGVGARNLQECLLIQLKSLKSRNRLAENIVSNYLQQLADRKWKQISQKLQEPLEKIQAVFDFIQTLEPRPGSAFTKEVANYIKPDMIILKEQDELSIHFNEQLMPQVKIERTYEDWINQKDHEAQTYMKEKLEQVHFIQKALEQRLVTMKKVMLAIIERQVDFFHNEKTVLKPLTMKEVAEAIAVHESTVSRAVNGKYVQTPKGTFELKYFFATAIQTDHQEDASAKAVKAAITTIISEENKKKPLSDQQIVAILKERHSYHVSRRTVAKYRDQLGILASAKRKRY